MPSSIPHRRSHTRFSTESAESARKLRLGAARPGTSGHVPSFATAQQRPGTFEHVPSSAMPPLQPVGRCPQRRSRIVYEVEQLFTRRDAQLGVDVADMRAHRVLGHEQLAGYVAVVVAAPQVVCLLYTSRPGARQQLRTPLWHARMGERRQRGRLPASHGAVQALSLIHI